MQDTNIVPITLAGVLSPVGTMSDAIHAIYYRIPCCVFRGDDNFLLNAKKYQGENPDAISVVDLNDGFLKTSIQAGIYAQNLDHPSLIVNRDPSPGHYEQGRNPLFARDIVGRILNKI